MRSSFAIPLLAFALVAYGFTTVTHPLYVDGQLVVHGHKKMKCSFRVLVRADASTVANAPVDTSGHFELSFTPAGERSFDFFYIDSHHPTDTLYLRSYKEFDSDELKVTFYTFKGIVPVDADNHVICPKCKQSDRVMALEELPGYYSCSRDRIKF